jgi:signal transduction histidine kinase
MEKFNTSYQMTESEYKVIQNFDKGVIITDIEGNVKFANNSALTLLDLSLNDIKDESINELLMLQDLEDQKPIKLPITKIEDDNEIKINCFLYVNNKSEKDNVEIKLIPGKIKDQNPESIFIIINMIDTAEKLRKKIKELKEEKEKAKKELQQFAYVISHDLQEPLRMVKSYTQLLERRYSDKLDQSAKDFIDFAVDGADRMSGLIKDLLKFSRVETRGEPFEPTDTNKIVKELEKYFNEKIQEDNATIKYDDLPIVKADKSQLYEVFKHLIQNALKFRSEKPPRIEISANKETDKYVFLIQDNGIGIEEKDFERIFIIFQRLHTRSEYAGTGIGLALCKRIIERHGGEIWVDSTVGEGSKFYFSIPIREN